MKRYLSSTERLQVITISAFIGQLNEIIKVWDNLKRNKDTLKNLRTSSTFAQKALNEIFKQLDTSELDKTLKAVEHAEFTLDYKDSRLLLNKKEVKAYDISKEERDDIAEMMIETKCKKCSGECKECYTREMFLRWETEPFNTCVEKNKCPFKEK